MSASNELVVLVNDNLNLLRGKLVRFILEDGDLRMIANLVQIIDQFELEYDPVGMVYRDRKGEEARSKRRAQLAKELEPGLNALFGKAYSKHDPEAQRQERNRKARERYHAKKKKKVGRPRKAK